MRTYAERDLYLQELLKQLGQDVALDGARGNGTNLAIEAYLQAQSTRPAHLNPENIPALKSEELIPYLENSLVAATRELATRHASINPMERLKLQQNLQLLGLDAGPMIGIATPQLAQAITRFEQDYPATISITPEAEARTAELLEQSTLPEADQQELLHLLKSANAYPGPVTSINQEYLNSAREIYAKAHPAPQPAVVSPDPSVNLAAIMPEVFQDSAPVADSQDAEMVVTHTTEQQAAADEITAGAPLIPREMPEAHDRVTAELIARQDDLNYDERRHLQQQLADLNLYPGEIDGILGSQSDQGVARFEADHSTLVAEARATYEQALTTAREQAHATLRPLNDDRIADADSAERLSYEQALDTLDIPSGRIDGELDAAFYKALASYRAQHDPSALKSDALDLLGEHPNPNHSAFFDARNVSPEQAGELQLRLAGLGIDAGPVDRAYGGMTERGLGNLELLTRENAPLLKEQGVQMLKERFANAGFYSGPIDGQYDEAAQQAATTFLQAYPAYAALGIEADRPDIRLASAVQNSLSNRIGTDLTQPLWVAVNNSGKPIAGNGINERADTISLGKGLTVLTLLDAIEAGKLPENFFELKEGPKGEPYKESNHYVAQRFIQYSHNHAGVVLGNRAMAYIRHGQGLPYEPDGGLDSTRQGKIGYPKEMDDPGFMELIYETAKRRGYDNTHFVNSHGYPIKGHYSTPLDLAHVEQDLNNHYPDFVDRYMSLSKSQTRGDVYARDIKGSKSGKTGTGGSQEGPRQGKEAGDDKGFMVGLKDGGAIVILEAAPNKFKNARITASHEYYAAKEELSREPNIEDLGTLSPSVPKETVQAETNIGRRG